MGSRRCNCCGGLTYVSCGQCVVPVPEKLLVDLSGINWLSTSCPGLDLNYAPQGLYEVVYDAALSTFQCCLHKLQFAGLPGGIYPNPCHMNLYVYICKNDPSFSSVDINIVETGSFTLVCLQLKRSGGAGISCDPGASPGEEVVPVGTCGGICGTVSGSGSGYVYR